MTITLLKNGEWGEVWGGWTCPSLLTIAKWWKDVTCVEKERIPRAKRGAAKVYWSYHVYFLLGTHFKNIAFTLGSHLQLWLHRQ